MGGGFGALLTTNQSCILFSESISSRHSSAFATVCRLISSRLPLNSNLSVLTQSLTAIPIKTRPTGFDGVPPPGPAMPVVEIAQSVPVFFLTPVTIAIAV